jgi:hypothetical protein
MNSTTSIWAGAGLVVAALLIMVYRLEETFSIAWVFGVSIILIGLGLIANGLEENPAATSLRTLQHLRLRLITAITMENGNLGKRFETADQLQGGGKLRRTAM